MKKRTGALPKKHRFFPLKASMLSMKRTGAFILARFWMLFRAKSA